MLDVSFAMSLDLNSILKDWPHESGSIKVRKVAGLDGREKLQLRVDLGVLQMELTGRPDGRRPHNCESLLEYYQSGRPGPRVRARLTSLRLSNARNFNRKASSIIIVT